MLTTMLAGFLALLNILPGQAISATDPVVDGRLDSQYVFLQAYTTIPTDPKNEPAPGVLYGYEGTSTCYWAFVIDRGFNDNVYVPDGSDDAYLIQDGWVKSDGSVQSHRFDNLHKSDKAQFTITGPSGSHAFYLDLLHQTKKDSTDPNDYISGLTGHDSSNTSDPYVNAAATSTHWNILHSGWSQWYNRSPNDFNYNTNSGNYWEWQIIYEFSIPKSALSGLGINSGCGDMAMTDAHNSPSKYVNGKATIGDYVWKDANANGLQDDGGPAAGIPNVTLYLKQSNTVVRTTSTAPDGSYSFVNLDAGTYVVDVDESTLPSGYTLTTNNEPLTVNLSSGQNYKDADFGYNDQTASLGDRVWLDENQNGIQDGGEPGVPGVTVKLLDTNDNVLQTTTTDGNGFYSFHVLTGTYKVLFERPPAYHFTIQDHGIDDTIDSDANATTGKTGPITVNANDHRTDIDAGLIRNPDVCYAVADSTTSANDSSQLDTLAFLDRTTGATAAVGSGIGNTGRYNIEAMAFQPGGDILYAADADRLGTLDLTTGAFTAKPQAFGTGSGSLGNITFDDVDGLTFDPTTGKLYGTHRRSGNDLLFQIDPSTGAHVPDAFGAGVDYVPVGTVSDPDDGDLRDVDDIAVDPVTGTMYAIVNEGSSTKSWLVQVDKATGAVTPINPVRIGSTDIQDIEGLAFFNDGKLYGSSGKSGPTPNALYRIDTTTAQATHIGNFTEPLRDFEALGCLTARAKLVVEKSTNGQDADDPTGPYIREGQPVTWTYTLRNTGAVTITNITVADDKLSNAVCTVPSLAPGAQTTCQATGVAALGQYTNTATATGTRVDNSQPISDTDPSHYFGVDADITITPQSAINLPGQPHTFTVTVTAEGKAPDSFTITPSVSPTPDSQSNTCASPTISGGGMVATCTVTINHNSAGVFTATASADVAWGSFHVMVSTDGSGQNSGPATKTYRQPNPDYAVDKALTIPGPFRVGESFSFTVRITNTGDVPITVLPLRDVYTPTYMTYIGANPAPNSVDLNVAQLDWNDLTQAGAGGYGVDLAPGQFFTVVVEFVARKDTSLLPGGVTHNVATVHDAYYDPDGSGPLPPQPLPNKSDSASVEILAPTAVDVVDQAVTYTGKGVEVRWRTVNESNMAGFRVMRIPAGQAVGTLVSEQPAAYAGQPRGASYQVVDAQVERGRSFRYELVILGLDGSQRSLSLGEVHTGARIYLPAVAR